MKAYGVTNDPATSAPDVADIKYLGSPTRFGVRISPVKKATARRRFKRAARRANRAACYND